MLAGNCLSILIYDGYVDTMSKRWSDVSSGFTSLNEEMGWMLEHDRAMSGYVCLIVPPAPRLVD